MEMESFSFRVLKVEVVMQVKARKKINKLKKDIVIERIRMNEDF
jgi:hypothetical protein